MAQKAAKLRMIPHCLSDYGDQADRRGFLVHHANRHLICNDA